MKAIKTGNEYRIYDDSLQTFDTFPPKIYNIRCSKMSGFYLEEHPDFTIDEKIYGVHPEKVEKVIRSFAQFQRNLGVILSGAKGIGKSLFARMVCIRANQMGLPVFIADQFYNGIAAYIESIDQEAVVLFDEFDKTFGGVKQQEGQADAQAGLLSLFDGTSVGKKLFIITCNSLSGLSDFLVNRPGRFHYHFRFECPTPAEVTAYLRDKLPEKYYGEIDKVVTFSQKTELNYDCLRAIAFELSNGEPFERAILDLNILNTNQESYRVTLRYNNGEILTSKHERIDLFTPDEVSTCWLDDQRGDYVMQVTFRSADCIYDVTRGQTMVDLDTVKFQLDDDLDQDRKAHYKALKPVSLTLSREMTKSMHYML